MATTSIIENDLSIFKETETKGVDYNKVNNQEYFKYQSNNNYKLDEIAITNDIPGFDEVTSFTFDSSCSDSITSLNNSNNINEPLNIIDEQDILSHSISLNKIKTLNNKIFFLEKYVDALTNELSYNKLKEKTIMLSNIKLKKELKVMNKKLNYAIPIHAIFYMCINMFILGISSMLLYLRFVSKIYTIDPYYLIGATIISLGLFLTALVSLKDWKEFLKNNEFEQ